MSAEAQEAASRLVRNADFKVVMAHMTTHAAAVLLNTDPRNVEALQEAALSHAALSTIMDTIHELAAKPGDTVWHR